MVALRESALLSSSHWQATQKTRDSLVGTPRTKATQYLRKRDVGSQQAYVGGRRKGLMCPAAFFVDEPEQRARVLAQSRTSLCTRNCVSTERLCGDSFWRRECGAANGGDLDIGLAYHQERGCPFD